MRNKDTDILKVKITEIDYDIEDGEENDLPDTLTMEVPLTRLLAEDIAGRDVKGNIHINREKLSEMASDFISNETGWCHTGFNLTYAFLPVNKVGKRKTVCCGRKP